MENDFYFGHIKDSEDPRDFKLELKAAATSTELPESVDLRELLQSVKNQGKLSSCTAFATTAMVEFVRNKQKLLKWDASPLFTYYATRKLKNATAQNTGAQCRDALKSVVKDGVTKEEVWPYDVSKFAEPPPDNAWTDAEKHQALVYYAVEQTRENILGCLAEGYPFTFGMKLYQSFFDSQCKVLVQNYVPMPDTVNEEFLGGHCMLAVGYSKYNNQTYILVKNSWGPFVGLDGYHNIPIEYFLNPGLSMDFWTVRSEEKTDEDIIPETKPPTSAPEPPKPVPTPAPVVIVEEPKTSIWKSPVVLFMILFILICLIFVLVN